MESKKINQLATNVAPQTSDLTIIGDPVTGVSKKITLLQIADLFATTGTVTSVAVTETGDALTITGSPITTSGTINIGFAGTSGQYVNGEGGLTTFPDLSAYVTLATTQNNISGTKTFTSSDGSGFQYGISILKNNVPPTPLLDTYIQVYSEATANNIVFRDNLSKAKFIFNNSTQTFTFPNATGTIALLEGTQTFTGTKTFSDNTIFSDCPLFNRSANYKVGATLVGTGDYIAMAFDKSGTGSGSTLSMKLADGTTAKGIILDFVGSPATYTYTFPDVSGTIALTSNLSAYVPYTGATASVNLGGFGLIASTLNVTNTSTLDGNILLKKAGILVSTPTYVTQFAASSGVGIGYSDGTGGGNFAFPTAAIYTYTFPAATGTIALTSNLSAYLPLSGGTLTGALSGTSATFSGNMVISQTSSEPLRIERIIGATTYGKYSLAISGGGAFSIYDAIADADRLTITSTGAATFSSSITSTIANGYFLSAISATTSEIYARIGNTSSFFSIGCESSTGGTIVGGSSAYAAVLSQYQNNALQLATNNLVRLTITGSGNVGIGTSSPTTYSLAGRHLELNDAGGGYAFYHCNTTNVKSFFATNESSGLSALFTFSNHPLTLGTNNTERMRITSGGYLKASNWGSYFYSSNGFHSFDQSISDWTAGFVNYQNSGNSYGIIINYPRNAPNNGGNEFFYCADSSGVRAIIKSNGGFVNYQANDGNLSDIRTKKDIIPLESYWDKFKAIEIVKFKYKDQTHDDYNIGVIAQQVESVAPEFVDIEGFGKDNVPEDGIPLKTIYTADLHHTTIKVLQEAMAKIETLETELTELKALIAAK